GSTVEFVGPEMMAFAPLVAVPNQGPGGVNEAQDKTVRNSSIVFLGGTLALARTENRSVVALTVPVALVIVAGGGLAAPKEAGSGLSQTSATSLAEPDTNV